MASINASHNLHVHMYSNKTANAIDEMCPRDGSSYLLNLCIINSCSRSSSPYAGASMYTGTHKHQNEGTCNRIANGVRFLLMTGMHLHVTGTMRWQDSHKDKTSNRSATFAWLGQTWPPDWRNLMEMGVDGHSTALSVDTQNYKRIIMTWQVWFS